MKLNSYAKLLFFRTSHEYQTFPTFKANGKWKVYTQENKGNTAIQKFFHVNTEIFLKNKKVSRLFWVNYKTWEAVYSIIFEWYLLHIFCWFCFCFISFDTGFLCETVMAVLELYFADLCLQNDGIKGIHHHHLACSVLWKVYFNKKKWKYCEWFIHDLLRNDSTKIKTFLYLIHNVYDLAPFSMFMEFYAVIR